MVHCVPKTVLCTGEVIDEKSDEIGEVRGEIHSPEDDNSS